MRRPLAARFCALAVPLGAAGALLLSVGPAHAGTGYGQLIVNPGTAAPGQSVSVLGTCPNNGQGFGGVKSAAFVGGSASVTQSSINFSGSATIAPGTSGTYTVSADCGSGSPSVTITVSGSAVAPPPSTQPADPTSQAAAPPPATTPASAPAMPRPAAGGGAAGGGMSPANARPAAPAASGAATATGSTAAQAMSPMPGTTAAGNGPVTSTGIVRVGLAGSSRSALTTAGAAAIAVALALAGGVGFLVIRRRRNTSGTHF
ncbi:hypothetical protein KGA66_17000 [Actinocrinis puniceicyclus]|uniref:LPXTG-motif cell wall anchor domain protein n=1 Tax=Actinocrinis puniceicyclus TaxID=977794 RepID=A0A8J7WT78_9ACTN|nr:hypothetical protein [Actinocrinis puniceicyclus]MBS2964759.1 hypothetical protein [Actinocrinis puniceicyclus]